MKTWVEAGEAIDHLIHDAEHAEAGRDFAKMMNQRDPYNPQHREAMKSLDKKALKLRIEAINAFDATLRMTHGHVRKHPAGVRARCGGPGMCTDCQIEQHCKELVLTPRPENR